MKTQELEGALLALWVARAIGRKSMIGRDDKCYLLPYGSMAPSFAPHENWSQVEQVMPKHAIIDYKAVDNVHHFTFVAERSGHGEGSSFNIALCRAVVNAKYGDTVPDDLGDM